MNFQILNYHFENKEEIFNESNNLLLIENEELNIIKGDQYVKEDNEWEKDIQHEKLDYSIKKIQSKQMDQLQEWTKEHPNWVHNL